MRVDVLHRRLEHDINMLHPVVDSVFPVELPSQYLNRSMNIKSFIDRLNVVCKPFSIFNEIQYDPAEEGLKVSGLWLSTSELPENDSDADVRVLWHIHPNAKRRALGQLEWSRRRYFWWQVVMHELIHRHQDVYRTLREQHEPKTFLPQTTSRSLKESQVYLGNYDEIEAHAHNAALEFHSWWTGLSFRDAVMQSMSYTGRVVEPTYNYYAVTFGDTPRHPAFKVFRKKVKSWHAIMAKRPDVYRAIRLPKLVG